MTTPMATEPCGRLLIAWFPEVEPEPAHGVEGQVDVVEEPESMAGVPTTDSALPKLVVAGVNTPPSTLTSASWDVRDGEVTVRSPSNSKRWPS